VQLVELDDEAVAVVDRVVSALLIVQRVRLGVPGALADIGESISYPEFGEAALEFNLDAVIDVALFHEDAHDLPTTPKLRLETAQPEREELICAFLPGDEVEVALPDPIGPRPGQFIGVEASGSYLINLGGGISKAFPPKDVKRRRR
jgi:hypothetical protein